MHWFPVADKMDDEIIVICNDFNVLSTEVGIDHVLDALDQARQHVVKVVHCLLL